MVQTFNLYDGKYTLEFHEGSHRYLVNKQLKRGVTGILSSTLAKEGLALWPLDEALKYLFGQEFEEVEDDDGNILVKPKYNPVKAFLLANKSLTLQELQLALEQARNAHIEKRDKGADTGSQVHQLIADYLTAGYDVKMYAEAPKEVKTAFKAFLDWSDKQPIKETLLAERPLYSEQFDYCGTVDHILKEGDKLIVRDYKTTNYSRTAPLGIYAENFAQLGAYAQAYEEEFNKTPDELEIVNVSKQGKVQVVKASELNLTVQDCKNLWLNILATCRQLDELKKILTQVSKDKLKGAK